MFPIIILYITDDDDREFMKQVYIDNYAIMRSEAYKILNRTDALDDLIQDTCVKLIDKIQTLRRLDCCRLRTYVVLTIRSVAKNFIKHSDVRKKHIYLGALVDVKETISDGVLDEAENIESTIICWDEIEHLQNALSKLPERDRWLLECKYILEMRDDEIAEQIDVKPASVREYLTRARRKALAVLKEGGVISGT